MIKIPSLLVLTILFLSCSNEKNDTPSFFYIIKHGVPQPVDIYGIHNFILLDSTIFYFSLKPSKYLGCGTDSDERPARLYLTPDSLTQLTISELQLLLKSDDSAKSLMINYPNNITASISTPTDTIKNVAFDILYNFFKENNIKYFRIRNWTEEEQYVTLARNKNQVYQPDSIRWKTGFAPF